MAEEPTNPVAMGLAAASDPGEPARLRRAAAGDGPALRWLLDEVAPVVYGFIYARVGGNTEVADDLLQEVVVEAVRGAEGFRGDAALSTWMCAIARRRLARHYEAERRAEAARAGLRLVTETDAEESRTDALERHDEVVRALGRLSPIHRQVLVLKYLDDQSVEAIADLTGRTRTQVQSLLQRARDALRRELGDADD